MHDRFFSVTPVNEYRGARYPAAPDPSEEPEEERPHPAVIVVAMLLMLGISIGLIGCYLRTDYTPETPGIEPDGGHDGDPPRPPDCDEGELQCVDDESFVELLEICEEGEWVVADCQAMCREEYGPDYASWGCDAESENPCQCEYDLIGGEPIACNLGDLICVDGNTLGVCEDEWDYTPVDCNDYCVESYGSVYVSMGCDEIDPANPCQCEFDIIMGEMAVCTPGDIMCFDEDTLGVCEDEWAEYRMIECSDYCVETFGSEYFSLGCDASADDHCQCVAPEPGSGGSGE